MVAHKNRLQNLILKNRRFAPQAFHYVPWDYVTLNGTNFQAGFMKLKQAFRDNPDFHHCVMFDLEGRDTSPANVDFVLEEVVATHLIRQKLIELPKTLVRNDLFRMVVYPGPYIHADYYQYAHDLLPKNPKLMPDAYPYAAGHYDFAQKVLYDFRHIDR